MLKAEDLLPIQDVSWPSEDLGTRRPKQEISRHENIPMDIVKTEPLGDPMDVDDVPAATDDLAGLYFLSSAFITNFLTTSCKIYF